MSEICYYNLLVRERKKDSKFEDFNTTSFDRFDFYFLDGKYKELLGVVNRSEFNKIYNIAEYEEYVAAISDSPASQGESSNPFEEIDRQVIRADQSLIDHIKFNNLLEQKTYFLEHFSRFASQVDSDKKIVLNIISKSSLALDLPWNSIYFGHKHKKRIIEMSEYRKRFIVYRNFGNMYLNSKTLNKKLNIVILTTESGNESILKSIENEISSIKRLFSLHNQHFIKSDSVKNIIDGINRIGDIDILHYTGHSNTEYLNSVSVNEFVRQLSNCNIKTIVINSCLGGYIKNIDNKSVACKLITIPSVKNVIVCKYAIDTILAEIFVDKLYRNLLFENNIIDSYIKTIHQDDNFLDKILIYGK